MESMGLSPSEMQDAIIKNLPEKTGKDIHEWIKIAKSIKTTDTKDLLNTLKSTYGLGHFQAQTIIQRIQKGR